VKSPILWGGRGVDLAVAGAVYLAWATTWPVGKVAMATWTPLGLTTARHVVAGGLLLALAAALGAPPRRPAGSEFVVGVLQFGAYFVASYRALEVGAASVTAVVAGAYPVVVVLYSSHDKRRSAVRLTALGLTVLGVALVASEHGAGLLDASGSSPAAIAWAAGAAVTMAVSTLAPRPSGSPAEIIRFTARAMLCGAAMTGALAVLAGDGWTRTPPGWESVVTLAWLSLIGSAMVFVGLEWLLRHHARWLVSMGYAAVPALAALMSVIWLGEPLGMRTGAGIVFTFCGLAVAAVRGRP
jgi:drug/metabolite transporter (DMT)-like permease